jgi:hypothetical protein
MIRSEIVEMEIPPTWDAFQLRSVIELIQRRLEEEMSNVEPLDILVVWRIGDRFSGSATISLEFHCRRTNWRLDFEPSDFNDLPSLQRRLHWRFLEFLNKVSWGIRDELLEMRGALQGAGNLED